ncbi:MAG: helix-turn-helix transcriptional regulator, partial [Coriobacteriales bacterium]|jgi:DNA-binding CsgD family transcriptional regulator|nr:helix-turn-helix transcriptional regulator [Coriobacteriales bacterium]
LAHLLGYLTKLYIISHLHSDSAVLLALSIVLAFFVGALFLYGGHNSPVRAWLLADAAHETSNAVSEACMVITNSEGLSPREHEILLLLARGRNAAYIARALYIAPSTVKTHIKSIYRKLKLHSQQELMDRIEAASSETEDNDVSG